MATLAIIKTGGKQYLVRNNDEIIVDRLDSKDSKNVDLETLAVFSDDGTGLELGMPLLDKKVKAEVVTDLKGDKVRIAKFRAKVRYRNVKGFRAALTRIKVSIA